MNTKMIKYLVGYILKTEALLMLLPCLVALVYREKTGYYFLFGSVICALAGYLISRKKPDNTVFYLKEGCVTTALSWIALSFFGCLPFYLSGEIPKFIDALFETISGFTTTGASILSDIEVLSHCTLFWRSFTHWIGGMGVLVFILAIMPMTNGSSMNLMKAESPGPSVGKLVPKVRQTARILYIIYFALTVLQFILLIIGKMPVFDALTTSIGTAGTGGFGIKNDSLASYSTYIQWVVTIFMLLFGINFNAYYLILIKNIKSVFSLEEVRYYFYIVIGAVGIIFVHLLQTATSISKALTDASFQVASIISTTGFSTTDFDQWSGTCKTVLVLLTFTGACAGSTAGGMKISRITILIKSIFKELRAYIHPKSIHHITIEGKKIDDDVSRSANAYLATFFVIFAASLFLVSFEDHDFVTNFTAVATTMNNVGPGLELVGPTCNFGFFNPFTKLVLMFDMLAGRLELFPLLLVFHPTLWKDVLDNRKKRRKKQNIL